MDIGTAKDMITDMHHEINALRKTIETKKEAIAQLDYEVAHFMAEVRNLNMTVSELVRVCDKAYTKNSQYVHHEGCLAGMMCSCGLMHYLAYRESQK
jgi:archaellum component FlaC